MKFISITLFSLIFFFTLPLYGQITYQKTIGGPGSDAANYLIETGGNFLIAGYTSVSTTAPSDAYLVKTDANGNILWQKKYGDVGNDQFRAVAEANDGGYIAVGAIETSNNQDIYIVRVDDSGNELWSRTLGGSVDDIAWAVLAIDGGYVVSGAQSSLSSGSVDGFAIRLDNNGNTVWTRFYSTDISNIMIAEYAENGILYMGGGADAAGALLRVDLSTGVSISGDLLDGSSTEALYFVRPTLDGNLLQSDHSWSSTGGSEIRQWTRKITKNGTVLWSKVYGSPGTNLRGRSEVCSDGGYLITPWDNFQPASSDPILIKLDADGNVQWSHKYGGLKFDRFLKAEETADGGFIAVGHTKSPNQNGNDDILLVKTDANGRVEGCCVQEYDVVVENYSPAKLIMPVVTTTFLTPENNPVDPVNATLAVVDYCRIPQPAKEVDLQLCEGDTIEIGGQAYFQSAVVVDTIPGISGCDTIATYNLAFLPAVSLTINIEFCPGDVITIQGVDYTEPGSVEVMLPAPSGCDTLATYILRYAQQPTQLKIIELCAGETFVINGIPYTQPAQVQISVPATSGCDTLLTYVLTFNPLNFRSETREACVGDAIIINGIPYHTPGTVIDTVPGLLGCDTIVTYTLVFNPLPQTNQTIEFCPGSSVIVNGQTFTAPGTTQAIIPAVAGCDTVLTYIVQYYTLPQPSNIQLNCPASITVDAAPGAGTHVVTYGSPSGNTDCVCAGYEVQFDQGLPSGSAFPVGETAVCYSAGDACGSQINCCFTVTVNATPIPADPCDVKVINCIKYELLTITADAGGNRTYRIRVTNNCANPLIYFAVQLPDAVVAMEPLHNSVWTSESGRSYEIRNPNFSPFYSIRFKAGGTGIANGASDIFEYTLPAQVGDPLFINVIVRLEYYTYYEAHLNTFYCPVGTTPLRPAAVQNRTQLTVQPLASRLLIYPNPAQQVVNIDLGDWQSTAVSCRLLDTQGRIMWENNALTNQELIQIELPENWPNGLYIVEIAAEDGGKTLEKVIIQR